MNLQPASGRIAVGSLSQARKHKRKFDAVLTIEDPACRLADRLRFHRQPSPAHLVLAFEDVDVDTLGIRVASRDQVSAAIEFGRSHAGGSLLVHCFHGVGRSAAIALALWADRLGPNGERKAIEQMLEVRPEATPNLIVVALADEILGREGALLDAVAAWEKESPQLPTRREARLAHVRTNPHLYARIEETSH